MANCYPFRLLHVLAFFIVFNTTISAYGQAPNISYPVPPVYTAGKAIAPLSPTNTGGYVLPEIYGIFTFAGSTGTNSTFAQINGVKYDGAGNIYVTDATQRVLKITPDGLLTVIAGSNNNPGYMNGQGLAALFNQPGQITTDASGNIYVADERNNVIREVTPSGLTTTYAGTGALGSANGPAGSATFFQPTGLVFDAAGNLYVSDFGNNVIRKITPGGVVSTFAGKISTAGFSDGIGAFALFSGPGYMTIDPAGNIYVSDYYNGAIRKMSPAGVVTTLAGNGQSGFQNGTGTGATFSSPGGLAIDAAGNLFVADEGNFCIRRISPAGVVTTYAGNGIRGAINGYPLTSIELADPRDIAEDADGNLYIADGNAIRKIDVAGYTIDKLLPPGLIFDRTTGVITGAPTTAWPTTTYTITAYNSSGSSTTTIRITVNPGSANAVQPPDISYLTPQQYKQFKTITPLSPSNSGGVVPATIYGQAIAFAGSGAQGASDGLGQSATFSSPAGITIDPSGNFFITETGNTTVRQITPQAAVTTFAGKAGNAGYVDALGTAARFANPIGITADATGNLYVADAANNVIRKITAGGTVSTFAGTGTPGNGNGPALQASFNQPTGVAMDGLGNLYVADQKNNLIRKIATDGTVTTFAGNGVAGNIDGPALQASFNRPFGIAIDASGNVYISDQNSIREINTGGVVSSFAGGNGPGPADGQGISASFNNPEGMVFDASGNLYVADAGNDLIRRIKPQGLVTTVAGNDIGANSNEKNFNKPTGITIDGTGNAYITEFGGSGNPSSASGDVVTQLTLTGYTIDKVLPGGLAFDPKTGTISGTPVTLSPPTNYTITAYNGGGSSSFVVNISVIADVVSEQAITFGPLPGKTYGDVDFDPGATSTNNTIPIAYASGNTGVATIVNGLIHITGAGTSEITASQAGNDNYADAKPVTQLLTVARAPLLIVADDKTKYQGQPNPPLTFTATGFVYNENSSVLTEQPVLSTPAIIDSPQGSYPINITGAAAANYDITMLPGTLTISIAETSIVVPNAFTPNGDGINDVWNIKAIEAFPQCLVSVYARNGSLIFQSKGYPQPWDGTYKGSPLPAGTYYYVINPAGGPHLLSGFVTILR